MARYIDADDLRSRVKRQTNPYGKPSLEYKSGVKVLNIIDEQPTADVVEVVRCGECVYRTSGKPSCQGRHKDWFCANGVRR